MFKSLLALLIIAFYLNADSDIWYHRITKCLNFELGITSRAEIQEALNIETLFASTFENPICIYLPDNKIYCYLHFEDFDEKFILKRYTLTTQEPIDCIPKSSQSTKNCEILNIINLSRLDYFLFWGSSTLYDNKSGNKKIDCVYLRSIELNNSDCNRYNLSNNEQPCSTTLAIETVFISNRLAQFSAEIIF